MWLALLRRYRSSCHLFVKQLSLLEQVVSTSLRSGLDGNSVFMKTKSSTTWDLFPMTLEEQNNIYVG